VYFDEATGCHVIDVAVDGNARWHERVSLDARDVLETLAAWSEIVSQSTYFASAEPGPVPTS